MKTYRFYDIDWDTDGTSPRLLGLPESLIMELADDVDPEMDGADLLSDKFGYCVVSFNFEKV